MSLYERVTAKPGGGRALAVARLRRSVLAVLHRAFRTSGLDSQAELAKRLRVRRSAVNQVFRGDGNVRIATLAEYLYEMGFEVNLTLVKAGELRSAALDGRQPQPAFTSWGASTSTIYAFPHVTAAGVVGGNNLVALDANVHYALSGLHWALTVSEPICFSFAFSGPTYGSVNASAILAGSGAAS